MKTAVAIVTMERWGSQIFTGIINEEECLKRGGKKMGMEPSMGAM